MNFWTYTLPVPSAKIITHILFIILPSNSPSSGKVYISLISVNIFYKCNMYILLFFIFLHLLNPFTHVIQVIDKKL